MQSSKHVQIDWTVNTQKRKTIKNQNKKNNNNR